MRDDINSACSCEHVSQTIKRGGGYLNQIKLAYTAGIELAALSGNFAGLVTMPPEKYDSCICCNLFS